MLVTFFYNITSLVPNINLANQPVPFISNNYL
jgi:hypothetical protein